MTNLPGAVPEVREHGTDNITSLASLPNREVIGLLLDGYGGLIWATAPVKEGKNGADTGASDDAGPPPAAAAT